MKTIEIEQPAPLSAKLRHWMQPLRATPLHPQFFADKYERLRYRLAADLCYGQVLDIGCGRQPLRDRLGDDCQYVGMDHPGTGALYGNPPDVQADAVLLPFKDRSFDTVVCLEVIEHLPQPEKTLREARRVLKPEGKLIISVPFLYPAHDAPNDFRRWTRYGLKQLIESSGLQIETLHTFGTPTESGLLLANLGLTWQALKAPAWSRLPLLALAGILVPFLNLFGCIVSLLTRSTDNTPFAIGYLGVLRVHIDSSPTLRADY